MCSVFVCDVGIINTSVPVLTAADNELTESEHWAIVAESWYRLSTLVSA